MNLSKKEMLEAAARQYIPENTNLFPCILAGITQWKKKRRVRRNISIIILLGLVISGIFLLRIPVVAQKLQDLFGFIPGVGIVREGQSLRILAEPASQTQSSVIVTVSQGYISGDQTIIFYNAKDEEEKLIFHGMLQPDELCMSSASLRLPDGTLLPTVSFGTSQIYPSDYTSQLNFPALAADDNEAVLLIPCLEFTRPGEAPSNWEIPLTFVQAPPDFKLAPVVAVAHPNGGVQQKALTIDQYIQVENGYILMGSFHSEFLPYHLFAVGMPGENPVVTDANGAALRTSLPEEFSFSASDYSESPWNYKVEGQQFAWPLTITFPALIGTVPNIQADITFDTGPNPQDGQIWNLDQDILLADHHLKITTVERTSKGYVFHLQAEPPVYCFSSTMEDVTNTSCNMEDENNLTVEMVFAGSVPEGYLTLHITDPSVVIEGPWEVQWQP
jgi:hypothetical protein